MPPSVELQLLTARRRVVSSVQGARYENEYLARTDTILNQGELLQLLPTATPYHVDYGDAFPGDPKAFVVEIEVEPREESKFVWEVRAKYETEGLSGSTPLHPLARPLEIRWGFHVENRTMFKDFSTPTPYALTNSAGERLDPMPQRRFGELFCQVIRNEAVPDFLLLREMCGTINNAAFTLDGLTIPEGRALLEFGDIPKLIELGIPYYRVTYIFWLKEQVLGPPTSATVGWNPTHILDYGFHELSAGKLVPIPNSKGMPVTRPHPLDGTGLKRPSATDQPAELDYMLYRETDFSLLGF